MTKNEDISNPFEVTERKALAVQNIVDKNKYLTILFSSQDYTHLDTCPKFHPGGATVSSEVMLTRWRYCFNALMITRWHYCISVEMVTG